MTFNDWLHALWDEANIPHNKRNAQCGIAWMYTESGSPDGKSKTGKWNPLGSTWKLTAATAPSGVASDNFNSVPVQNYHTFQDGLYATKRTLLQQAYGIPRIVKHLRSNQSSAQAILEAIDESQWGTSGLIFAVYKDVHGNYYWERAKTLVSGSY